MRDDGVDPLSPRAGSRLRGRRTRGAPTQHRRDRAGTRCDRDPEQHDRHPGQPRIRWASIADEDHEQHRGDATDDRAGQVTREQSTKHGNSNLEHAVNSREPPGAELIRGNRDHGVQNNARPDNHGETLPPDLERR